MVQAVEEAIQHAQEATPGVLLLQQLARCSDTKTRLHTHRSHPAVPVEHISTVVNLLHLLLLRWSADSGHAGGRVTHLQEWLEAAGVQLPTPAARELRSVVAAAEDSKRLRKQLEALREAELELAAREAEENERGYAMLVGWGAEDACGAFGVACLCCC
jgi:hypothetical protein